MDIGFEAIPDIIQGFEFTFKLIEEALVLIMPKIQDASPSVPIAARDKVMCMTVDRCQG